MKTRHLFICIAIAVNGCATLSRINLLTTVDEVTIGKQAAADIERSLPMMDDPLVTSYIDSLGAVIAQHASRQDVCYKFDVVETAQVNAFALPGGWLYVNAGLIMRADTESELAGVMAHEIGHVVGRHGARQISSQYGLAVLLDVVAGGPNSSSIARQIGAQFAGIGAGLTLLKYSRDMEREADQLAVEDTYAAGIDPRGVVAFFEKLMALHQSEPEGLDVLFTTHPPSAERVANVKAAVDALPPKRGLRKDSAQFQKVRAHVRSLMPRIEAQEKRERQQIRRSRRSRG